MSFSNQLSRAFFTLLFVLVTASAVAVTGMEKTFSDLIRYVRVASGLVQQINVELRANRLQTLTPEERARTLDGLYDLATSLRDVIFANTGFMRGLDYIIDNKDELISHPENMEKEWASLMKYISEIKPIVQRSFSDEKIERLGVMLDRADANSLRELKEGRIALYETITRLGPPSTNLQFSQLKAFRDEYKKLWLSTTQFMVRLGKISKD